MSPLLDLPEGASSNVCSSVCSVSPGVTSSTVGNTVENTVHETFNQTVNSSASAEIQTETRCKTKAETETSLAPVYVISQSNANEIDLLLRTQQTYTYDGVEMSYSQFPKPLLSTSEGIVKRENDVISGDMPFNDSVSVSAIN